MKSYRVFTLFVAFALALGACNLPTGNATPTINANAVFTAAAQTVMAKLTENAAAEPSDTPTPPAPTNTPQPPTDTPQPLPQVVTATNPPIVQPTSACDAGAFVSDVTVPDGTNFTAGTTFTKTWRIRNAGTCTWNSSYALTFDSGTQMGGPSSQPLTGSVAPGANVDISVNLQAPNKDGNYTGVWGLTNASGSRFPIIGGIAGRSFSVVIVVGSGGPTATSGPTPNGGATPTNDPNQKFKVLSMAFQGVTQSGGCSSSSHQYIIPVVITVNNPGTVTYHWVRSDGGPEATHTLTFNNAGSQTVTYTWTTTKASGLSIGIYDDSPNHQSFGSEDLQCP